MSADKKPEPVRAPHLTISEASARVYSDAIADVLCWFRGFRAANREAELPPGLNELRKLSVDLKHGGKL